MPVLESIEFFRSRVDSSLKWLPEAESKRDYVWYLQNSHDAFKAQIMVALLQWRHGVESPHLAITRATDISTAATRGAALIVDQSKAWMYFDFGSAFHVAYLAADEVNESVLQHVPTVSELLLAKRDLIDFTLNAAIAVVLSDREETNVLDTVLAKIGTDKRRSLLRDTYANYRQLMAVRDDRVEVERRVRLAEDLFRKRKKNSYYAGGVQTEGGGPDNDDVVDYHLAALIKWCERKNPALKIDSIHRWRW